MEESCGEACSPGCEDTPRRKGVAGLPRLPLESILSGTSTPLAARVRDLRVINANVWCEIPLGEDSPNKDAACGDACSAEFISDLMSPLHPVSEIQRRLEFIRSPRTENRELPPRVACGPARGEKRNHSLSPSLVSRQFSCPLLTRGGDGQLGRCESQEMGSWDDVSPASSTQGDSCPSSTSSSASFYTVEPPAPDGVLSRRTMSMPMLMAPSRASTGPACDEDLPGASSAAALAKLAASDVAKWMALPTARLSEEDKEMVSASDNFGKEVRIGRHLYLAC